MTSNDPIVVRQSYRDRVLAIIIPRRKSTDKDFNAIGSLRQKLGNFGWAGQVLDIDNKPSIRDSPSNDIVIECCKLLEFARGLRFIGPESRPVIEVKAHNASRRQPITY